MLVNYDPHNWKQKELGSVSIERGEIMWVHPDLLVHEQWSSSSGQKKTKEKVQTWNIVSANLKENHADTNALTNLENKIIAMATHVDEMGLFRTRSSKNYLKDYLKVSSDKPAEESRELSS